MKEGYYIIMLRRSCNGLCFRMLGTRGTSTNISRVDTAERPTPIISNPSTSSEVLCCTEHVSGRAHRLLLTSYFQPPYPTRRWIYEEYFPVLYCTYSTLTFLSCNPKRPHPSPYNDSLLPSLHAAKPGHGEVTMHNPPQIITRSLLLPHPIRSAHLLLPLPAKTKLAAQMCR